MTWNRLLSHAIGVLRLTKDEFLRLTWIEYEWVCKAYVDKNKQEWERAHWIVYNTAQFKNRPKTFQAYLNRLKPKRELTKEEKDVRAKVARKKIEMLRQRGIFKGKK